MSGVELWDREECFPEISRETFDDVCVHVVLRCTLKHVFEYFGWHHSGSASLALLSVDTEVVARLY